MKHDPEILLNLYFDDPESMSDEEIQFLSSWICRDPANARRYVRSVFVHQNIHDFLNSREAYQNVLSGKVYSQLEHHETFFDSRLWQSLAEHEEKSPAIPIAAEPEESVRPVRPNLRRPADESRMSRSKVFLLILSSAAMFLLLSLPYLMPRNNYVADLIETIDAQWGSGAHQRDTGRFHDRQDVIRLQSGLAKILFHSGVETILEGPCEFQITTAEDLVLYYGQVFVSVPQNAIGFTVKTPHSKVIDLGTEFGVRVGGDGASEVHVFKGKASLVSGSQGTAAGSISLQAGQARQVDRFGQVREIAVADGLFARKMYAENGLIWRGEALSLADIVQGGNGRGASRLNRRIHPNTGQFTASIPRQVQEEFLGDYHYHPVLESPFIDGVFVPDRQDGSGVVISSGGHQFSECPDTCNKFHAGVYGRKVEDLTGYNSEENLTLDPMDLRSISDYIMIHTNQGITFDLDAIRQAYPEARIDSFTSFFQFLRRDNVVPKTARASFWILVDGSLRQSRENVRATDRIMISLDLQPQDRFLTLVTTDAGPDDQGYSAIYSDYCIFANPSLLLE